MDVITTPIVRLVLRYSTRCVFVNRYWLISMDATNPALSRFSSWDSDSTRITWTTTSTVVIDDDIDARTTDAYTVFHPDLYFI